MGIITIDGRKVEFTDEKNVLSIIRNAGINIPTLCYHSEVSTFGACRLCTVEDDRGRTFASCSEEPRDGMVIYTNTGKLKKYRKLIVELLLAAHCRDCTTCVKSGECNLQTLALRLGIIDVRFNNTRETHEIDKSSPGIIRDPNKCILCGDCVRACEELQGIGCIGFAFRGTEAMVMPAFNKNIAETDCVNCGQCRVYCPTGAISIHTHMDEVWEALADPDTRVVIQVAPAVRVAVGDAYNINPGKNVMGKLVNALHRMGFDEVYDTTFGADLTIVEESAEFARRLGTGKNLPIMTSCCPAWVKYVCDHYPDYKENLSTCRSPMGMLSAVVKEHYRNPKNVEGKKTVVVAIMPCTAKKQEAIRPNSMTKGEQDTDYVLTTTEIIRMINNFGLDFKDLEPEAADVPFGLGSGGGVIFGVTGGVTEAALRHMNPGHDKETMMAIAESGVRGENMIKEFKIPYEGRELSICVVNGLANARIVMDKIKSGEAKYDFLEVMACRRGCIMGGGQPVSASPRLKKYRAKGLYHSDSESILKKCDDNPLVQSFYNGDLKGMSHDLLHNKGY